MPIYINTFLVCRLQFCQGKGANPISTEEKMQFVSGRVFVKEKLLEFSFKY